VKDKEDVVGSHVRVKVVKNKVAAPFRQAEFDIMYAEGISHASLVLDIASEAGIIEKSGAWYSYQTQRIGQGRENAKMFLKDNPALMADVEEKVKGVLGIAGGPEDAPRRRSRRGSRAGAAAHGPPRPFCVAVAVRQRTDERGGVRCDSSGGRRGRAGGRGGPEDVAPVTGVVTAIVASSRRDGGSTSPSTGARRPRSRWSSSSGSACGSGSCSTRRAGCSSRTAPRRSRPTTAPSACSRHTGGRRRSCGAGCS
jgi:hypothetical protein